LVGDAACFIDPVFSSGVHLATFSAYLVASAIDSVLKKTQTYEDSAADYEARYRREYMAFYRFLVSFYELHADHDSYFWQARKLLDRKGGTDTDAFISLVSGQSTAGDLIFSPETFEGTLRWGVQSLTTLVSKASGGEVKPTELASARKFILPTQEARHHLLKKSPE
jgi:halogenation protein CepH